MPGPVVGWWSASEHRVQLRALLAQAWPRGSGLDYAAALDGLLDAPGVDDTLHAAGFVESGEAACLALGLPRRVARRGREMTLSLLTAWCASPTRRGEGLGSLAFAECAQRARRAGFDGVLWFTTKGLPTGEISRRAIASTGADPHILCEAHVLVSPVGAPRFAREDLPRDAAKALLAASAREASTDGLVRLLAPEEAEWMTRGRSGGFTAILGDGVITGAILPLATARAGLCARIELASWGSLAGPEREELARRVLTHAAHGGAALASVAPSREADEVTWRAVGMRRSAVTLQAWMATWTGAVPVEPCTIWHDPT